METPTATSGGKGVTLRLSSRLGDSACFPSETPAESWWLSPFRLAEHLLNLRNKVSATWVPCADSSRNPEFVWQWQTRVFKATVH